MNFNPALNTIAYVLIILSIAFIIIQYSQSNVTIDSVDAIKDKMKGIYDYMPKSKTEFKWFIVLSISAGVCGEIIFRFFLFEFLVINTNIIGSAEKVFI